MSLVNVNRANRDDFYRYKMPRLMSKIEGKGNGIKTVVPNMEDIAKALSRPPSYPTKFFGCELGAQTQMDEKNSRYIVNGAHEERTLSDLLDKFIKKFVLCASCSNPETVMLIDRKQEIWLDCKACGARNKVDNLHKLRTFILNNPPPDATVAGSAAGTKSKKSKEERRKEKNERAKQGSRRASDSDDDGDDKDDKAAGDAKPAGDDAKPAGDDAKPAGDDAKPAKEQDDSGMAFTPALIADGAATRTVSDESTIGEVNEEFTVDEATLERVRRELAQDLSGAVKNLVVSKDDDATEGGDDQGKTYEEFADYLGAEHSAEDILAKIQTLGLKEDRAVAVFVQVTFTKKILEELVSKKMLLQKLVKSEKATKGLIGGLERLAGVIIPELTAKFAKILKVLYDEDILAENVIMQWNDKVSKKFVDKDVGAKLRVSAKPMIDWLRTAEEESEEEDE